MATEANNEEELLRALHQRMITSGTWSRLLQKMNYLLRTSDYAAQLTQSATAQAVTHPGAQPTVEQLIEDILPKARQSIPPALREEIMQDIINFLQDNLEVESS